MKKSLKKSVTVILTVLTLVCIFAFSGSAAEDGWTYTSKLPDGITPDLYTIEYKNIYTTVASSSPGSEWTQGSLVRSEYVNDGDPYYSNIELETGNTRVLLAYNYYHYCSSSMGVRVNFDLVGAYNHYDSLGPSSSFYEAGCVADDDDPRYKAYILKYYDGGYVYCSSGFSCDGSFGYHGQRSYIWYKTCKYQDKKLVNYYNYEMASGWVKSIDPDADSYRVRYKLTHEHSYGDWKVTNKATFTEDGSRYRICKDCKKKDTDKIEKVSNLSLSTKEYTYNGKVKTPSVTVKDSAKKALNKSYYKIAYASGRKNIGTYNVRITLKGAYYEGSKVLKFTINPAKVKTLTVKAKENKAVLSWDAVGGNVKYRVYKYNPTTKKIAFLKTTSKTTCTISSLKSTSTYYFVVKAYKTVGEKTYYSDQSKSVKVTPYGKPATVTGLTHSEVTSSSVTLKWSKAAGNNVIYYVYSYNSSTGDYKYLGKTSKTTYKVSSLKSNKTYKFAVRSYSKGGEGYKGKMSKVYSVKTKKPVTAPSVGTISLSTENKVKNVLIKWTTSTKADGYIIFRSTTGKSDSYSRIKTITSSSTGSYRDTNVKEGKTYYYKVRSYIKVNGETIYGKLSDAKKITTYKKVPTFSINTLSLSFSNSNEGFNYPYSYYIPYSSYTLIYGDTALAQQIYYQTNYVWGGNCYGMSTAVAMFNVKSSGVTVKDFNSSATYPKDLACDDIGSLGISLTTFIEAMQVSQYANSVLESEVFDDLDYILTECKKIKSTGIPAVISVYGSDNYGNKSGHSLLAYGVEKVSDSETEILLYDSNHPLVDRRLTIYTDSQGNPTGWYYNLFDGLTWSSSDYYSAIGYLAYEDCAEMWTDRSTFMKAAAQSNALFVNSDDISVCDENGKVIATLVNGRLVTDVEGITFVQSFISKDSYMLYLPADKTYTVINNDEQAESFEVKMISIDRCTTVTTEADNITLTVSDTLETNAVTIDSEENEDYTVVLDYSDSITADTIEISGTAADDDEIVIADVSGTINVENCDGASVVIGDGKAE